MHMQSIIMTYSCRCVPQLLFSCAQYAGHDIPLVLVGNKCDSEERRVVSQEKGRRMAINIGAAFLEVNAKTDESIKEV